MKKSTLFFLFIPILIFACTFDNPKKEADVLSTPNISKTTIGLYPLGNFDSSLLATLKNEITQFYNYSTVVLEGSALPPNAYYKPRNRYRADSILDYLLQIRPKNIDYIVGLTEKDISCTNGKIKDWGVFGLGFMPGRSCVISTYRLKPSAKSNEHFRERLAKVVIHELGHNFGLDHCPNPDCIMRDAEGTIKSVDQELKVLCKSCKTKLSI